FSPSQSPIAIVYADKPDSGNRWDVESAWLIYQTLESATGRKVDIYQLNDLPDDVRKSGNLILVGMPSTHTLLGSIDYDRPKNAKSWITRVPASNDHGEWLIVAGEDEASLAMSAEDLVLRYWKTAKDSAARRIGLSDKPIEKGPDPNALP